MTSSSPGRAAVKSRRVGPDRRVNLGEVGAIYHHYKEHTAVTFETSPVCPGDRSAWLDEHLRRGPHRLVIAEDPSGRLLGWATTSPYRPRAAYATTVEASVYCEPTSVGRGVGSSLYRLLFRSIEAEDLERIVAGVTLPNPASLALHQKFGFRPVGVFTRVGRKLGRYWDVAWLERPLHLPEDGLGSVGATAAHSIDTSERM